MSRPAVLLTDIPATSRQVIMIGHNKKFFIVDFHYLAYIVWMDCKSTRHNVDVLNVFTEFRIY